jgi:hypothetical protein
MCLRCKYFCLTFPPAHLSLSSKTLNKLVKDKWELFFQGFKGLGLIIRQECRDSRDYGLFHLFSI